MRARGIRPKKRLGQHFLLDAKAARRVADLTVDAPGERVLEIGAGTGILTAALLALGARLTAIEIDPGLAAHLRERFAGAVEANDLEVYEGDALAFDFDGYGRGEAWRVAGNLPYNVGTTLLVGLATRAEPPERIAAMLQKDVVDRLVAAPGSAAYGSISILVAATMRVRRAFSLRPSAFHPRPNVDSSVVVLERRAVVPPGREWFTGIVKAAFAYRRKTLANSLSRALGIPRERTVAALGTLSLDPEIRAERLDLDAFTRLAAALAG
ncbi:MAG: ribosomal RNA small subunit methyltransferase A [Candidatus Eremiobacteraeota bacterium]|nr:ribosomal RNA small subunit methyltransferase A [Candidatus Eremiobacteraeota bacterium]MBV8355530.1 ribosomal RNA small subunit methyltransferase A [Candidatus Eremiobacteraeota bacterium]